MRIAIISASTRINRQSHRVALALEQYVQAAGVHTVDLIDLAAYAFPVMEEVLHRHPDAPPGLADFADRVREADAFLFVSPEYNGSYTAALKNAVDYLKESEFSKKVIGVVSVTSGPLGGMRAAMNMQELVLGIAGFALPQMLLVGQVSQRFDETGALLDPAFGPKVDVFLKNFLWLAEAVWDKKQVLVADLH
ncbi:MAG: NADPH-dependent FMN reductase [Saprospiraceae bacterium]|nr:NADPH-dependent FMN reductase [Saprospiraceae bacterium]